MEYAEDDRKDRLADLEARQRKLTEDLEDARRTIRGKYAALLNDLPIEKLSEREFRELLTQAIRVGGTAALAAMKGLPPVT
jgi:hypothetical protein